MKKTNKLGKAMAITAVGIGLLAGGALAGAYVFPKEITTPYPVPYEVIKEVQVEKEVLVDKIVEVEKIVNNTIEVEVPFEDLDFKKLACDRLLFEDLKECQEEVEAEDLALNLAFEEIKKEFADILEDEGIVDDEDEVEIVKIYDDFEDIEVLESDFDDNEYEFKIKVKVDDDDADEKKYVYFTVSVEDSEAKITDVTE